MNTDELRLKVMEFFKIPQMASVATIKDNEPWVRYMMVFKDDDLNLFTTTFASSRKVEQIKKNNKIHITVGGDPSDLMKPYINIKATAHICDDVTRKKKYWSDMFKAYYKGPDDPNFLVIQITPQVIEYSDPKISMEPEILTLN